MLRVHNFQSFALDRRMLLLTVVVALAAGCQHARPTPAPPLVAAEKANFGYGLDESNFATSGIESAAGAEMDRRKVAHVAQLLEGRFAGVQVQRTASGDYSVRIRGVATFIGDGEPLWVLDGMPIDGAGGRGVSWINPADVARIDVLKDPASTAVYGVRGANGVILITTKRGR